MNKEEIKQYLLGAEPRSVDWEIGFVEGLVFAGALTAEQAWEILEELKYH